MNQGESDGTLDTGTKKVCYADWRVHFTAFVYRMYQVPPARRVVIPNREGGKRPLDIADLQDKSCRGGGRSSFGA
ncbi:MAG: hypothetical protein OXC63_02510 [Aestuariivita sp.]|nr:hypothetical protein [Aestuariivita sp.]